jgi:sugar/nucleoside kinase (ribokinase family)
MVIGTCGCHGTFAWDGTTCTIEPSRIATIVDRCGAGHAFAARYVFERLAGHEVATAMRAARTATAATCAFIGSFPQVAARVVLP